MNRNEERAIANALACLGKRYMSDVVDNIHESIFYNRIPERKDKKSLVKTEPHVLQYVKNTMVGDINVMTSMGNIAVCMMMISEIYNIPLDEMLQTLHRELEVRGL